MDSVQVSPEIEKIMRETNNEVVAVRNSKGKIIGYFASVPPERAHLYVVPSEEASKKQEEAKDA